jgi:hypothetical protein
MRDQQIIRGFEHHDRHINGLRAELKHLAKEFDKVYLSDLTHRMMWDVLMGLLEKKGLVTKLEFDEAMKTLSEATQKAMEAENKAKADAEELAKGKVTVLSDKPAIPVVS